MNRFRRWAAFILILDVIGAGGWLVWQFDLRWRPHIIARDQAQIAGVLQGAGWVSPHLAGPKVYVIAHEDCTGCAGLISTELPKLEAAGVETRVIMIALADKNGQAKSTPAERSTVAELWVNRDWKLFQRWMAATPPRAWTAPGVPTADGDAARTAVLQSGRAAADQLRPLLGHNGVRFDYPLLIWWNKAGVMHACLCRDPRAYRPVEKELGA